MGSFAALFVQQFIQVTLVVAVAVLLDLVLQQKNWSRGRFVLWLLVLIKLLTPPVISSPTGVFSLAQMTIVLESGCGDTVLGSWASDVQSAVNNSPLLARSAIGIWLAGVLVLFAIWSIRLWTCCCAPIKTENEPEYRAQFMRCESMVDLLCGELRLARRPRIALTESNFGPAVYGLFYPRIVIPIQVLLHLSDAELRPVLAHEIIHIQRRDTWVGLLQLVAAVVWWFHPCAWIAIRRLSDSLEIVTDDDVICSAGVAEHDYARSLLSVIEVGHLAPAVTGAVGVFTCQVTETRIKRLISRQTCKSRPLLSYALVLLLACLILPGRGLLISQSLTSNGPQAPASQSSHP